ncbi:TIM barrel protein [Nocardia terpenica]|uniref:Inosose dehydratase n=1 Tax=Nocardia terpenica TaxID=455432 RepID=A0A164J9C7_9NOCA|nr:TIM barrel protein [Nocardia terpenica]KZM70171.1 inosose dehydratase [Nocardia terpenica]MBF6063853.1 TIM barrel protein [Nocardia terpenica]MBF6108495.1 TIM barrel protein [Nocardia terpenica]MBF6116041.1 TIM barrel protein [Nocardia terpenica]MBF6121034.1 TIM barrel protein [Nocardia terpenica]
MTEPLHPLRIAAAPISWGVCEVPGWGEVLDARTVLSEMAALGLTATEFGPPAYLPTEPRELRALLEPYGITAIGGFLALPLHTEPSRALAAARESAELFAATGAEVLVLAAATGQDGYDARTPLSDYEWRTLIDTAASIRDIAAEHGLRAVLHPHVGTHVETEAEVERFLADSELDICLDTGHLLVGGTDPVALARRHAHRIGHIHLKDVRKAVADEIRGGRMEYSEAVRRGLYVPLGEGDVDVAALIRFAAAAGYRGWYVIEQDTALSPGDAAEAASRDAARSLRYLADVGAALESARI